MEITDLLNYKNRKKEKRWQFQNDIHKERKTIPSIKPASGAKSSKTFAMHKAIRHQPGSHLRTKSPELSFSLKPNRNFVHKCNYKINAAGFFASPEVALITIHLHSTHKIESRVFEKVEMVTADNDVFEISYQRMATGITEENF